MPNWNASLADLETGDHVNSRLLIRVDGAAAGTPDEAKEITLLDAFALGATRASDGTASAPGIAFGGAPSTGLYRTASGVGVTVGGTTRLFTTSTGRLGIGTSAPAGQIGMTGVPITIGASGGFQPMVIDAPAAVLTDGSGLNNSVGASWAVNINYFADGPVGRATYYDTTMGIGLNLSQSYSRVNPALAGVGIGFESLYANPGQPFATETHFRVVTKDTNSEIRWISNYGPELESDWPLFSINAFRASQQTFYDGAGRQDVIFDLRSTVRKIIFARPGGTGDFAQLQFQQNNRAPFQLLNGAGNSYLSPMTLNAGDRLLMPIARTEQITINSTTIVGVANTAVERQFLGSLANAFGEYETATITGNFTPRWYNYGCSGSLLWRYSNITAGGLLGHILNTAAGRSFVSFENGSAGSVGPQIIYDNVADVLRIDASGYRGSNATTGALTIARTTGKVTFIFAPTAPSYQVGNVQVVGARDTGWTAMTGTASKGAMAAAPAGTASATYAQAELQAALNRIAALEARLKAHDDALFAHGLIGA